MISLKSIADLLQNKMRLIEIFEDIDKEVFSQTQIEAREFEDIFEDKLRAVGYSPLSYDFPRSLKDQIVLSESELPNTTGLHGYIREPFNSQSPPDFLIFEKHNLISLDLKSSKDTGSPMWNNSIPKQATIYLMMGYSCKPDFREVVFFKGSDVITKDATKVLQKRLKDAQDQSKFTKEELAGLDIFNHGWNIYVRANYHQSKHQNNPTFDFTRDPNKEVNKQKVLEYLNKLSTKAS